MKKTLLHTVMPIRKMILLGFLTICVSCFSFSVNAQAVGNWTFNNTLSGTGSSSNSAGAASLGSAISTGDYNGGTVYYGEGSWPAGVRDANAYLQFSLTPNGGYKLNLSFIAMKIRRSTTGTAAGSGPNTWSLRSSIDNYASDIATGTLTMDASTAINVSFPSGYTNLSSTVAFRLYGYNATVSTGGLNRFVYDNITINGATILPVVIENFKASMINDGAVQLAWELSADESMSVQVERSINGIDYAPIKNIFPDQNNSMQQYTFVDQPVFSGNNDFYYRLKVTTNSNNSYYSAIQKVSFSGKYEFGITALPAHAGGNIQVRIKTDKTDNYHFSLYNINGARLADKTVALAEGSQLLSMDNASLTTGIYILVAERSGKKISSKILVE